ncbi:TPA: hypothetical protein ACIBE2_001842 [Salmonella enterica subsp. diarizonae serovar 61:r:-]|nr:hypothetical protein [Salmonella enterica]
MATIKKTIGRDDWTQITTGTQSALVQFSGDVLFCDNPVKPEQDNAAHYCEKYKMLNVTPPATLWVKTTGFCSVAEAIISVSKDGL